MGEGLEVYISIDGPNRDAQELRRETFVLVVKLRGQFLAGFVRFALCHAAMIRWDYGSKSMDHSRENFIHRSSRYFFADTLSCGGPLCLPRRACHSATRGTGCC